MYLVTFEENTHIADYVLIILFSFTEQLKARTQTVDEITTKLKMICVMWGSQDVFFTGRFRIMSRDTSGP